MGNEHKKGRVTPNKAGMYFSLAVCVIALALGSFSAVNKKNELYNEGSIATTQSVVEIRKNQTDVTKQSETATTAISTATTKETETKTTTTTSVVANHFVMPLGGTVKKEFSGTKLVYSETFADWRHHDGVDIAAEKGTQVNSAGKGKVAKVFDDVNFGKTVVINHGNGVLAYYCGLNSVCVSKDDVVEISQKIGVVGDIPCEVADRAHLHLKVTVDGNLVDPIKELEID